MCTDITTRKGKLTITVIDKDKGKEGIFSSKGKLTISPWVCLIKDWPNAGATFIIGKMIAKNYFKIDNLMQNI